MGDVMRRQRGEREREERRRRKEGKEWRVKSKDLLRVGLGKGRRVIVDIRCVTINLSYEKGGGGARQRYTRLLPK
jgi:hypothetical protein